MKSEILAISQDSKQITIEIKAPCKIVLPLQLGKFLVLFLRCIKDLNGVCLFSFQDISDILGHPGRQWSHNIYQAWENSGSNLMLFMQDNRKVGEDFLALITEFVLAYPLRSILKQHEEFNKAYPEKAICINAFRDYVSAIDCSKLITMLRKQLQTGKLNPKDSYFINVLLSQGERISSLQKKYIADLHPDKKDLLSAHSGNDIDWKNQNIQKYLLVSFLYIHGVPQQKLAFLFGVSKTSIHNWVHKILNKDLKHTILNMLTKWSGKICVDEKWIRVAGKWQYVLTAVDSITGIPLLSQRFESCNSASWILFFKEFKLYYGKPKLIISDGSDSLLIGLNTVFKGVRHQLCWFHKLKNLHKRIYQIQDDKTRKRAFVFAKGMFHNKNVSSRKYAAKQLAGLDENISKYITKSILNQWLKLTSCLTSNAAERYNRKIEKCINSRYGVKNEKCADALINGLWFSDILGRGSMHCQNINKFENFDFSKILKDNFENKQIIHFFNNNETKVLNNAA